MLSKLIQIFAGVTIAGGIVAYNAKDRATTFEEYGLNGETLKMAQSCDSSMRRYNLEFRQGASNHAGCACFAREVSTTIENPDYEFLQTGFSEILEARHNEDDDAAAAVVLNAMMSGDVDKAQDLMTMVGFMSTCSNRTKEQEVRQSYIAENLETQISAGSASGPGLRSDLQPKPTGKCAKLTDEQVAQRTEDAKESGLRFDRATCNMYSL